MPQDCLEQSRLPSLWFKEVGGKPFFGNCSCITLLHSCCKYTVRVVQFISYTFLSEFENAVISGNN